MQTDDKLRQKICDEILAFGYSKREGPSLTLTLDRIFAAIDRAGYHHQKELQEATDESSDYRRQVNEGDW